MILFRTNYLNEFLQRYYLSQNIIMTDVEAVNVIATESNTRMNESSVQEESIQEESIKKEPIQEESKMTPWEVKGKVNYMDQIKKFGTSPIDGALIEPLTPEGRATVFVLHLNDSQRVEQRSLLIELGVYPC